MPNYDYECSSCGNKQEESHSMSGPSSKIYCKKCKSDKISKVISVPYVKFDGPGWQTNDVRGIAKTDSGQILDSSNFKD
jgi:putative FmdB family regulatory protein